MSPPATTLLRRGLTRRCAVCGDNRLFTHWVRMAPACPECGFVFTRAPGQWLGSWFLNVCLAQTMVVLILALGVGFTWPDPPIKLIAAVAALTAFVVPLAFFPYSRTLWVAIDLVMTPLDFNDGVAPGFLLEEEYEAFRREKESPGSADRDGSGNES